MISAKAEADKHLIKHLLSSVETKSAVHRVENLQYGFQRRGKQRWFSRKDTELRNILNGWNSPLLERYLSRFASSYTNILSRCNFGKCKTFFFFSFLENWDSFKQHHSCVEPFTSHMINKCFYEVQTSVTSMNSEQKSHGFSVSLRATTKDHWQLICRIFFGLLDK